ncbi:hypothetical protein PF005_g12293 [Phytophthora fragariae]|uniref:Uncharacterized protein n=1 Tax=Phytophthora fragariae TaxID=53985 RepID=A0A6A4DHZ7_9STRA|nr:hypothetical protein PF003_g22988 [Phytophthora fragariae]KAE8937006.1 hypothetical protein PF009_g13080 [Phytophthora fragariae]KAE9007577.1 hypothetical protein PF011_g11065 [Phytophthora fragariae]KAE9108590.1 hypothetical protein PF010_g11846 [Phytophthora fragariae]KAE9108675.1 hypothetical protein PF007_g12559 [Phytophthora fragariae]
MRSGLKDKRNIEIADELKALNENGVGAVEVPPIGSHVLHTKRVFKTKTDADGAVERFKARLVAFKNKSVRH